MAQKKFDLVQKLRAFNRPSIFQIILMGVGLVLTVGLWIFLTGFVSCWQVTSLPGIPLPTCSTSKPVVPVATNARRHTGGPNSNPDPERAADTNCRPPGMEPAG